MGAPSAGGCRSVLFASLVADPSAPSGDFHDGEAQEKERQRLFRMIEQLVVWENTTNERCFSRPATRSGKLARTSPTTRMIRELTNSSIRTSYLPSTTRLPVRPPTIGGATARTGELRERP